MARFLVLVRQSHRNGIGQGRNAFATIAGKTMTPAGRGLVLPTPGNVPTITDAGTSAAKQIELDDPLDRLEAELVKQPLAIAPA